MSYLLINAIESRLSGTQFNCPDIDDAEKFSKRKFYFGACSGQGAPPLYVDLPDTGKLADEYP